MRDTPQSLGLPEKFDHFRPKQEEFLDFTARSTKRVKAICGPTGSGKSLSVVADAQRHPNEPTVIVTESRALQDQYGEDYESIGMVDLRGRANYQCQLKADDEGYTCEQGYAARCPYKGTHTCPASSAEMRAAASHLVITNYDKWIHARRYSQGLSHIKRVVFDEGDQTFNALSRAMQITLHEKEIEHTLGFPFPPYAETGFFSTWRKWSQQAYAIADSAMLAARTQVGQGGKDAKASWVKHYTHMVNLKRRLGILATANPTNWVVEELPSGKGFLFDPIIPAKYAESALLLKVPDVTIVSATLNEKSLFMTGIGRDQFEFREFLSDFDPKRCPIYYVPTMRVDSKAASLDPLWARLDQIASARRDRNGLVHTISYLRRDPLLASSRHSSSMFINDRGEPPTAIIEQFVASYPGAILVSPAIGRGYDFKFKAAEWQFVCKVPFPPPSKVMHARTELDREYPHQIAMQALVQICGRLMRDFTDQGETFIGDDNLVWFLRAYGHLAPKSFGQFFTPVSVLPQPPARLR